MEEEKNKKDIRQIETQLQNGRGQFYLTQNYMLKSKAEIDRMNKNMK